ncbi:MAG: glycosyltransferase [Isosphaeraceae bacterium]
MRVLHFRQAFSVLTETFIHDTVVEMERQGVECEVLTLWRPDTPGRPFNRVRIVPLPRRLDPRRVIQKLAAVWLRRDRETFAWPMIRRGIARRLDEMRPDVIHAHFGPDAALIAPVADARGIPLVATFYGYDFSVQEVLERHKTDYRRLFEQSAAIIGVSRHACDRLIDLGASADRVELVRLGVRMDNLRDEAGPVRERPAGGAVRCLHVGRLVPKKSPVEMVEAFAEAVRIVGGRVGLSLTIVGDGSLRDETARRAAELGIASQVELTGALPHAEALRLMAGADIQVQHSVTDARGDQEGQPVSLAEAAGLGLPIVSTRHSGIPDVVLDGRTGFLVDEHDVAAMGERIARLALDPALRAEMGNAGQTHVAREFSLERETANLIGILERAAAMGVRGSQYRADREAVACATGGVA